MKTFDLPCWMSWYLYVRAKSAGLSEADFYLNGAGRALGFVRMATCALDEISKGQKVAEYHAYVGISAARTSIDATACWLEEILELQFPQRHQVNLSRPAFRKAISGVRPEISEYVKNLGDLGDQIDEHRNRAQHREGLAIITHAGSEKSGHPGGWYLMPEGLSGDRADDVRLMDLLNGWADEIENNFREVLKVMAPEEMQQVDQRIAWQSKLKSAN